MRPAVYLSEAAYMAGGLDKLVKRLHAEREAEERKHQEELRQRARERRAERKAAQDFSDLA